jgi:hypothetical protein
MAFRETVNSLQAARLKLDGITPEIFHFPVVPTRPTAVASRFAWGGWQTTSWKPGQCIE